MYNCVNYNCAFLIKNRMISLQTKLWEKENYASILMKVFIYIVPLGLILV